MHKNIFYAPKHTVYVHCIWAHTTNRHQKIHIIKKIQYLKTDIVQIQRSKLQISNPPVNAMATVTAHNRETIRLGMLLYHISNLSVANTGFHCIANKTDT